MCTCIPVGTLHEVPVCPVGPPLEFPVGVPRSHQHPKHQPPVKLPLPQHSLTPRNTLQSHPPLAPSAGKGCSCLCWKLVPEGAGGRGLRLPSHRPWQCCGGRHGRRGGPACPAEVGHERLEPCAANVPGAALSAAVYTAQHTGGPANGGSPAAQRGNLFPRDLPVQAISLLRPSERGRAQPRGQLAGRAASGPGARQPLLLCGRPATEKTAHLGWRCELALGAGGDRLPLPGHCVRLAVQQPGQPPAFTRGSNIKPRSAF